jgi:AraC-like DNA-binding protein
MPKPKVLSTDAWCAELLPPETRLEWMHGVLARVPETFGFVDRVTHDQILWLCMDGACEIETSGVTSRLVAGSVLWMPPGVAHTTRLPRGATPMLAYSFRFRLYRGTTELRFRHCALLAHGSLEVQPFAEALLDERQRPRRPARRGGDPQRREKCLLSLILSALLQNEQRGEEPPSRFTRHDRARLRMFARHHVADRPAPADLAQQMQLSPDYFARVFRRSYGVSARRWLLEERLREAAFRLTHSPDAVKSIAASLGYDDVNLFCRQFRQVMGLSPARYRRAKG